MNQSVITLLLNAIFLSMGFIMITMVCNQTDKRSQREAEPKSHMLTDMTSQRATKPNSHMLIIATLSRLGNTMFQYAAGLGIARRNRMKPVVFSQQTHNMDMFKTFQIDVFNVSQLNDKDVFVFNQEWDSYCYNKRTEYLASLSKEVDKHIMLDGYWANYRYFNNIPDETLRNIFTFKKNVMYDAQNFLRNNVPKELNNKNIVFIAVHIRLGDCKDGWGVEPNPSKESYLKKAAEYYAQQFDNLLFVVCSDNITMSKELFPVGYHVIFSGNSLEVDMAILASCNHTIVTMGSFGWWAGKLAGGQITYYANSSALERLSWDFVLQNIYPENWVPL